MMKRKFIVLAFLMIGLISMQAIAQDTEEEEVTEDEMRKFAAMEDDFNAYLQVRQDSLVTMIKSDETLGGAARYNEIKAAWGDEEKLSEIEITDEEREAFQKIQDYVDNLGQDASQYKKDKIMDPEVLGAATYNKVMKAMSSDPSVKEKIDSMISEMRKKRDSDDGDTTS
jgi:translation initiation factor 2B subunit (eIF-2B alpha/beta/delta family)